MLIQPLRGLLQLAADLVLGEQIKYAGLDSAFLAHYRSGGGRSLWPQQPKIYPTLSGPACAKTPIPQIVQNGDGCGRKPGYGRYAFGRARPTLVIRRRAGFSETRV